MYRSLSPIKQALEEQVGLLLLAYLLGSIADRLFEIFLLWSVAQSTRSSLPVSLAFVARFLPALIGGLGLYGALEKLGAARIMAASQAAKMLPLGMLAVLLILGDMALVPLLIVAFVTSLFTFSFDVSFQTSLPRFVKTHNLEKANAAAQLIRQMANLIGPMGAGLILGMLGELVVLGTALGITGGACIIALLAIRRAPGSGSTIKVQTSSSPLSPETPIATPLLRSPLVLAVILAILAANVVVATSTTLMPRYTQVMLRGEPELYGLLNGGAAAGAIGGAVLFGVWSTGKKTPMLPGVGLVFGALALSLLSITQHPLVALSLIALTAAAVINVSLAANVLLQRGLREFQLGRAMTAKSTFVRLAVPGISLIAGFLADALGLRQALAGIGLFVLLPACFLLLFGVAWRESPSVEESISKPSDV